MKTIPITEFKSKCLRLVDEVRETGEPLEITRRGKVVALLSAPVTIGSYEPGQFKDRVKIVGDIMEPVLPSEEWDLEKKWF